MWRDALQELSRDHDHPAWGYAHARRVYDMSLRLAKEQGDPVDEEALFAAAFLHDLGALAPYRLNGVDHAARSAALAGDILEQSGFPVAKVRLVVAIVRNHMFDAEPGPSREEQVFRDADILDFLGAIGIARLLGLVGKDDWAPDLPSALGTIKRFNRLLPGRLYGEPARLLGKTRKKETEIFLMQLEEESLGLKAL